MVMGSFVLKPSSLFSFVLHFVALSSSSCGGRDDDVAVVVVVVVVVDVPLVPLVDVVCFLPSLASSSCFFFGTGLFVAAVAAVVASLNFLHSLRCPPCFQ